jgi:hypothetical protein
MRMTGNTTLHDDPQSEPDEGTRAIGDAYERLRRQLEERPYETLALVAGVGFILGGGLFTRFAVKIIASSLRVGVAAAFAPLVDSLLAQVREPSNGHDLSEP